MFFNDSLASDSAGGRDILRGTPVRMPAVPEFESFNKIVTQVSVVRRIVILIFGCAIFDGSGI